MKKLATKELIIFSPIEREEHKGFLDNIYRIVPEDQGELQRHKWFIDPNVLGLQWFTVHNFHAPRFDAFFAVWYADTKKATEYISNAVETKVDSTVVGDGLFNQECMTLGRIGWAGGSRVEAVRRVGNHFYRPRLVIDDGVIIGAFNHIGAASKLHIQRNVLIGQRNTIIDHDHTMGDYATPVVDNALVCAPVTIGRGTWIGDNTTILKGVTIGHHSTIGAGAVVTESIPPYSTAVGVPAKVVKVRPPTKGLISIVIPTYNTRSMTHECIEYVYKNTPDPYEIILVDNGSRDDTVEFMESTAMCDKIITLPNNKGFAGGVNAGIQAATGEFICLLNSDVYVTEGWIEPLLAALREYPHIGIAAPLWNVVLGPQEPPAEFVNADGTIPFDPQNISHRMAEKYPVQMRLAPAVPAVCWLLRTEDVRRIGLFDEGYKVGNYEDDDYCRRMTDTLDKVCAVPLASFVYHLRSQTFAIAKIDYQERMRVNKEYYTKKWGEAPEVWQDRMSNLIRERINGNKATP